MTIYLSLLVALLGLILYLIDFHAKVTEIGRILFFSGVLAYLLGAAGRALSLAR